MFLDHLSAIGFSHSVSEAAQHYDENMCSKSHTLLKDVRELKYVRVVLLWSLYCTILQCMQGSLEYNIQQNTF
jgi:hypothetical protein